MRILRNYARYKCNKEGCNKNEVQQEKRGEGAPNKSKSRTWSTFLLQLLHFSAFLLHLKNPSKSREKRLYCNNCNNCNKENKKRVNKSVYV